MYKDHLGNEMKEGDVFAVVHNGRVDSDTTFRLMVSSTHYRIIGRGEFPKALFNTFEYESGLRDQGAKRVVIPKDIVDLGIEASVACLRLGGVEMQGESL